MGVLNRQLKPIFWIGLFIDLQLKCAVPLFSWGFLFDWFNLISSFDFKNVLSSLLKARYLLVTLPKHFMAYSTEMRASATSLDKASQFSTSPTSWYKMYSTNTIKNSSASVVNETSEIISKSVITISRTLSLVRIGFLGVPGWSSTNIRVEKQNSSLYRRL